MRRSRRGQVLVVSLAFLLPAAILVAFLHNHGLLLQQRQRLQVAADRAAVSGALLESDLLSSIAWTNLALADVHAQGVLHCVNTATAGTLAEIEDWGRKKGFEVDPPSSVGGLGMVERYEDIYDTATEELPKILRWESRLQQMQHNLAALGMQLVRREVYRSALVNLGVEGDESTDGLVHVALFPYERHWAPTGTQEESWQITYDGSDAGGGTSWSLANTTGRLYQFAVNGDGTRYTLQTADWGLRVTFVSDDTLVIEWFSESGVRVSRHQMTWDSSMGMWRWFYPDGTWTGFGQGRHGGTRLYHRGKEMEVLRDTVTGTLLEWNGTGWGPFDASYEFEGFDIAAGTGAISVYYDPDIPAPWTFIIGNDNNLSTDFGGLTAHFDKNSSSVWLDGPLSALTRLTYRRGESLRLNDWRVPEDASGIWRLRDTLRERLTEVGPNEYIFDIATTGSMLRWDPNIHRFGVDQSQDLFGEHFGAEGVEDSTWIYDGRDDDEGYRRTEGGWYQPIGVFAPFSLDDDHHFHRTVTCWHPLDIECPLPEHVSGRCPGNGGPFTSQLDGGWHDPMSGAWVECPLCDKADKDGDGDSDVRRYPESNTAAQGSRLRQLGDPTNFTMPVQPQRLVLAEDFFKWGLNLAVHTREYPFDRFILDAFFPELEWSPVATASARSGFVDPDSGRIRYRFDTEDERTEWVDENPWNLTATDWVASLVSTREALRLEDLELEDSFTADYGWEAADYDAASTALLRHLLTDWLRGDRGQWRRSWNDPNPSGSYAEAAFAKSASGESWDLTDMDLDSWIRH